jgi:hypothetical protein
MTKRKRNHWGATPGSQEIEYCQHLAKTEGLTRASEILHISRLAVASVAAGLMVSPSTLVAIRDHRLLSA